MNDDRAGFLCVLNKWTMAKISAGLVMFRFHDGQLQMLLMA
jgi:hypothetical protein